MKPSHRIIAILIFFLLAFLLISGIEIGDTSSDCSDGDIVYYTDEWICQSFSSLDTGGTTAANYTLDISTNDGTGEILNSEVLDILGSEDIHTSMSGNTITVDYNGTPGAAGDINDTNETPRVNVMTDVNCTGTDKGIGFETNGTIVCGEDIDTDTNTNAGTECGTGEYLGGDTNCYPFNDSVLVLLAEEQIIYNATSISTEVGTLDGGNISSIQEFGEGATYNITEVTGTPGFLININFTNVVNFNTVAIRGMYNGGSGHTVDIEIFRLSTQTWDDFGDITDQPDFGVTSFSVFIGSNFINTSIGNGTVMLRLNHDDPGSPAHSYLLDYIALGQITGLVSGGAHDDTTGRDNCATNHPDVLCTDGTREMEGPLNMSDNDITDAPKIIMGDEGNITLGDNSQVYFGNSGWIASATISMLLNANTNFNFLLGGTLMAQVVENGFVLGSSLAGVDPFLWWNGKTTEGFIRLMDDEGYLQVENDMLMGNGSTLYFNDTNNGISLPFPGVLEIDTASVNITNELIMGSMYMNNTHTCYDYPTLSKCTYDNGTHLIIQG